MDSYAGYRPPAAGWQIPVISTAELSAEAFYASYVSTRTPVILSGTIDPLLCPSKWSSLHDADVLVEHRDPVRASYGTGVKSVMRLSSLVNKFMSGHEDLYLTTQQLPEDDATGKPLALFGSPFDKMRGQFPVRPRLAGHLTPSSINMWLGYSRTGTSSNLHHDFHDNFYVLLRGRKRFTIAPPCDALALYPYGKVSRIHRNGLINYGSAVTRSDGAPLDAVVDFLRDEVARARDKPQKARIELALRAAQNDLVRSKDDVRALEVEGFISDDALDDLDASAADDMWTSLQRAPVEKPSSAKLQSPKATVLRKRDKTRLPKDTHMAPLKGQQEVRADTVVPPGHFSCLDLPAIRASHLSSCGAAASVSQHVSDLRSFREVQRAPGVGDRWPAFTKATLTVFDLAPGQVLYLPAGWFHEVYSFAEEVPESAKDDAPPLAEQVAGEKRRRKSSMSSQVSIPPGCHCAINYWFHPPLAAPEGTFDQPYPDGFTEHLFEHAQGSDALRPRRRSK